MARTQPMRSARARLAGLLLAMLPLAAAASEPWPVKPIRLVHGYATASSMDINSRAVAARLAELLGQQVIVDARPGATGAIAAELVAKSPPDGYTLLAAPGSSITAAPHLQKVRFDPLRDFAPVAPIGDFAYLLAAHPNLPARNVKELVALARKQPGQLSYGSNGTGSAYHLAGVLLNLMAGIDMLHVPYRGGGTSALTDLVTGRVDMMWNNPVFLLPHVRSGKLKAMAVTGAARISAIPDVPAIGETIRGYEISGWQGVLAPAGTPREVIARLDGAIQKALSAPDVKTLWNTQGMDTVFTTPDGFAKRIRADFDRYGELVRKMGSKLD